MSNQMFKAWDTVDEIWLHEDSFLINHKGDVYLYNEDGDMFDAQATLCRSTGLKDKNGIEIFEGDIIKIPDDYDSFGKSACEIYEIYFNSGGFRMKPKYGREARGYWLEDDKTFEIIGNIFEHKHLLEAKE